jgi:hypothetical protein
VDSWRPYYQLDLSAAGLLPLGWAAQIRAISAEFGVDTMLTGEGSTSREPIKDVQLPVRVVLGGSIRASLPWIWQLYCGTLLEFSARSFARTLFIANKTDTAVNVNHISGAGARYEWHVDTNPVTGLFFATDSEPSSGGALIFKHPDGTIARIYGKAGTYVCFDARDIEHSVEPLQGGDRITLPMNYYESALDQPRPTDLDDQIYQSNASGGPG